MRHFTRSRFAAAAVTLAGLATLAAGCGGPAAAPFAGNPAFQRQVQPDSTAAKQAAQQNLVSDLAALKKDARALTSQTTVASDLSTLTADFGTERQDWQSEQSDGCSSAAADAGLVAWDAQTVSRDAGALQGDLTSMQTNGITTVTNDLTNIQNDLEALKLLDISPQVTTSAEVDAGNQALRTANGTMTSAGTKAKSTGDQSQQILASAQQWAKQHAC